MDNEPHTLTNIITGSNHLTMKDLINAGEKAWNRNLIQMLMEDQLANEILKTPLYKFITADSWYWFYDKRGLYSMKSAYRVFMKNVIDETPLLVRTSFRFGIWKLHLEQSYSHRGFAETYPTRIKLR